MAPGQRLRRPLAAGALAAALLVFGTQVSPGVLPLAQAEPEPATAAISVAVGDTGITLPNSVAPGVETFTISNGGTQPHGVSLLRLNDGVDLGQLLQAAGGNDPSAIDALATASGGVQQIAPGESHMLALDLTPGNYVIADQEHAAEGVVAQFAVTGTPTGAAMPAADVQVNAHEFHFDTPETVAAGATTINMTDSGQQQHEMVLIRIEDGHTLDDLEAAISDPSGEPPDWVTLQPSLSAVAPGQSATFSVNLTPGSYAMLCFIGDPESGQPHAALGMVTTFTAQ